MSNLIFNLRIGKYHIQIANDLKFEIVPTLYRKGLRQPFIELFTLGNWNK